jgi:gliding motility-associated-like protein
MILSPLNTRLLKLQATLIACIFFSRVLIGQPVAITQPVANFSAGPTAGCAPMTVRFIDNSSGTPSTWKWDLGNGTLSGQRNPTTTFFTPGFYTVRLIVSNAHGTDTLIKTQYIRIYDKPVANFSLIDSSGCAPFTTQFTDLSNTNNGSIIAWEWDFGDGNVSDLQNPTNTYLSAGNYSVTLKATNTGGCINAVSKRQIVKTFKAPSAAFSFTKSIQCKPPETISFTNLSSGTSLLNYMWDFGNGNSSTAANPSNIYTSGGEFSPQLIVTDSLGCADTLLMKDSLFINNVSTVIGGPDSICKGSSASFTNNSIPAPDSSFWSFGDGTFSNAFAANKTWNVDGIYNVKLLNSYPTCKDSVTKTITVLKLPVVKFSANDSNSCKAPFTVNFKNLAFNTISWLWDFGDGNTSNWQTPDNTYNSKGSFAVKLTATDVLGCSNTTTVNNFIKVLSPIAKIANVPNSGCVPFSIRLVPAPFSVDGIANYFWDLGNGDTSNLINPVANYPLEGKYDIKLKVTSNDGCTDSATIRNGIVTNMKPTADFTTSPTNQCFGQPVQFTDLSPGIIDRWLWNTGDGGVKTVQNFQYVYKDTGIFTVRLIVWRNGCSDTITKIKYINSKRPVARFKTTYNCLNKFEISFTDTSILPQTWLWDFGDGSTSTLQNPVHLYGADQLYNVSLTVTDDTCSNTITKQIPINTKPPDFTISKNAICKSDSILFSVVPNANARYIKYTWNFGDGSSTMVTNKTTIYHKYNTAGVFTVILITDDLSGCFDTTIKANSIKAFSPKADFSINTTTGCLPLQITFTNNSSTANGIDNIVTYKWIFGDGQSQFIQAPFAGQITHLYSDTGHFAPILKITDSIGCIDSTLNIGKLLVAKPVAAFKDTSVNTCRNENIQLTNTSIGYSINSEWFFGDGTGSVVSNPIKTFSADGNYSAKLIVTDKYGCKDSIEKINYFKVQDVIPSFIVSDSVGTCVPFKIAFTNTSQFATSQTWDFGDGSTSNQLNPTHYYDAPGIYIATLTAIRNNNCYNVATKKIEIYAPTGVISYQPLNGCAPLSVNFQVKASAKVSYLYDFNDGTTVETSDSNYTYAYTLPGNFVPNVVLRDSFGCLIPVFGADTVRLYSSKVNFGASNVILCDSGLVQFSDSTISGSPISSFKWSFGDGGSSTIQNPNHSYTSTGLYDVGLIIRTIYGCSDTLVKPQFIKTVVQPQIDITGVNSFCGPSPVLLQGVLHSIDTSVIKWQWQFGNGSSAAVQNPAVQQYNATGNYQVILTATNSSGCIDTAKTTVFIYAYPTTFAGNDTTICQNIPVQLQATGADIYAWQPATLLSCNDCSNPIGAITDNTTLYLRGITNDGCEKSDTINIIVKKPFALTGLPAVDTICAGKSVQFNVSGAENYIWTPATGLNTTITGSPIATPVASTIYKVVGFDDFKCFYDSAEIDLRLFANPTVNAGEDRSVFFAKQVALNIKNSDDVTKWLWTPSIYLNCTTCPNPTATPEFNTTYKITVTNNGGCTATDEVNIVLTCDRSNLLMPTAFTPNNDNLNDVFYPMSAGVFKIQSFRIFNRLGELVFQNGSFLPNNKSAGWDGRYKGQIADTGAYIYVIEFICNNNNLLSFSGKILLLK